MRTMSGRYLLAAVLTIASCARATREGNDDLTMGNGGGDGGGKSDGGGKGDMATGTCPGKNLMTDPMNCGACGHVCMGAHVAMNGCVGGKCVVGTCSMGYFDLDQKGDNGCECQVDMAESSTSSQCVGAPDSGSVADDAPSMITLTGNIVPVKDEDWFQIHAVDTPEADGGCDKFHVKIAFAANPGMQFRFDVFFDDCMTPAGCPGMNETNTGLTEYEFDANNDPGGGNECPCNNGATAPNVHKCTDNSQTLRIRVYRTMAAPLSCEDYKLLVTNGM
jgi:hypothetical protein